MKLSLKKRILFIVFIAIAGMGQAQPWRTETLLLLFMGDIMGHDSQINSARQPDSSYSYTEVFTYVKPIIEKADLAIANLEVTLAGPPYKGYPQFSSPDALAEACKAAGIDVLGTANNHSVDRGKAGIIRTIKVLDSLEIKHTGTFLSATDRDDKTPFMVEKNGFKLALLNYTYGTNGIPVPQEGMVNVIDTITMATEIERAKLQLPDAIIMFIHWGLEYQQQPNKEQLKLADFLFRNGVNIIIGSHPHVIQKSVWVHENDSTPASFVTYSLGNFLSNQRNLYTDGGQMIQLTLEKETGFTRVASAGYYLTWVHTPVVEGKKHFYILPCTQFEQNAAFFSDTLDYQKMQTYLTNSRQLLNMSSVGVVELK